MIRLTPTNGSGAEGFSIDQKTPTLNNLQEGTGFTAPVIADRDRMSSKEVAQELSAKKIEEDKKEAIKKFYDMEDFFSKSFNIKDRFDAPTEAAALALLLHLVVQRRLLK